MSPAGRYAKHTWDAVEVLDDRNGSLHKLVDESSSFFGVNIMMQPN